MNSKRAMLLFRDGCVALCPLMALVAIRAWLGAGGPASASAAAPEPVAPAAQSALFKPMPPDGMETGYLARARALAESTAPDVFPRQARTIDEPAVYDSDPTEHTDDVSPPADELAEPEVVVTSIMGGRTPMAIINGRAHKVGDSVVEGWRIASIVEGRVVIVHRTGVARTLRLERTQP